MTDCVGLVHPLAPVQAAEWLPARVALLCEPRLETAFDLLQPHASNFLRPFSLAAGQAEHRAFRAALEAAGVCVIDLRDALASGPGTDPDARARLESWAAASITLDLDSLGPEDAAACRADLASSLRVLDSGTLVDLLLLQPTIRLAYSDAPLDTTTRFRVRYEIKPASAYYVRDPLITTHRGCTVGRLRLDKRRRENELAAWALEQLGIEPVYRVQAPGYLEGGDFLPAGDFALQGQGLLSDEEGVGQCLQERVYGRVEVAVVRDPCREMGEMHLDTYFALLGPDLCALCEDRIGTDREPAVDVYRVEERGSDYAYRRAGRVRLTAYLADKGFTVLPFSRQEQVDFAPNGLLVGPKRWLGAEQAGPAYARRLADLGVQVQLLPFAALTGGYGGPHCSSQVLVRG